MSLVLKVLYNTLLLPIATMRLGFKIFKDKSYKEAINERYGFFNKDKLKPYLDKTDILLHVVSFGEFVAAEKLIINLIKKYPSKRVVITCTTPTARKRIFQTFKSEEVFICYLPYDNKRVITKFISNLKPKLAIFVEKEIWPNLYTSLKKVNCKLVIINASLSEKSFIGYNKIKNLISPSIKKIDLVLAQDEVSATNFEKLGLLKSKISVLGNIKYDIDYPKDLNSISSHYKKHFNLIDKKILTAASTHESEEIAIINSFIELKKYYKNLYLIIAPRHPHRFESIHNLIKSKNLNCIRFTNENGDFSKSEVLLLDTMGQLLYFYKLSDVAFVGGSLIRNIGCHNILEPAMFSLPIVIGPNYFNFKSLVDSFNKNNAINITRIDLTKTLSNLFGNKDLRKQQGAAAYNEFMQGKGVLDKTLLKLEFFLKSS